MNKTPKMSSVKSSNKTPTASRAPATRATARLITMKKTRAKPGAAVLTARHARNTSDAVDLQVEQQIAACHAHRHQAPVIEEN